MSICFRATCLPTLWVHIFCSPVGLTVLRNSIWSEGEVHTGIFANRANPSRYQFLQERTVCQRVNSFHRNQTSASGDELWVEGIYKSLMCFNHIPPWNRSEIPGPDKMVIGENLSELSIDWPRIYCAEHEGFEKLCASHIIQSSNQFCVTLVCC